MNRHTRKYLVFSLLALAGACGSPASAQLIGPSPSPTTPYLSFADSPFNGVSFSNFYLENFEDHLLNTPGVTANAGGVTSVVFGPTFHDSVDADDGTIDGSGLRGDSYFSPNGSQGITFTFNSGVLGALPTHAGLVWTDGLGTITFEAFDQNGQSLGTVTGSHADGSFNGTTIDDRFYGVINAGGISAIKIRNAGSGIEIDHLQYGLQRIAPVVPEPGLPVTLLSMAMVGACFYFRRRVA